MTIPITEDALAELRANTTTWLAPFGVVALIAALDEARAERDRAVDAIKTGNPIDKRRVLMLAYANGRLG